MRSHRLPASLTQARAAQFDNKVHSGITAHANGSATGATGSWKSPFPAFDRVSIQTPILSSISGPLVLQSGSGTPARPSDTELGRAGRYTGEHPRGTSSPLFSAKTAAPRRRKPGGPSVRPRETFRRPPSFLRPACVSSLPLAAFLFPPSFPAFPPRRAPPGGGGEKAQQQASTLSVARPWRRGRAEPA